MRLLNYNKELIKIKFEQMFKQLEFLFCCGNSNTIKN